MSIKISCECGKSAKVKDELSGRKIKCPGCGTVIRVPGEKSDRLPKESGRHKRRSKRLAKDQATKVSTKLGAFDSQRMVRQDLRQSSIQDVIFVADQEKRTYGDLVFSKNSVYYVQLGEGSVPPEGANNRPPGLQPKELTTKFPGSFKIKKKRIHEYRVADNGKFTIWSDKGRFAWYLPLKYRGVIEQHLGVQE